MDDEGISYQGCITTCRSLLRLSVPRTTVQSGNSGCLALDCKGKRYDGTSNNVAST